MSNVTKSHCLQIEKVRSKFPTDLNSKLRTYVARCVDLRAELDMTNYLRQTSQLCERH